LVLPRIDADSTTHHVTALQVVQAAGEGHGAADNPGNLLYPNKNISTHKNPRDGPQLKRGGHGMQPDVISPEA